MVFTSVPEPKRVSFQKIPPEPEWALRSQIAKAKRQPSKPIKGWVSSRLHIKTVKDRKEVSRALKTTITKLLIQPRLRINKNFLTRLLVSTAPTRIPTRPTRPTAPPKKIPQAEEAAKNRSLNESSEELDYEEEQPKDLPKSQTKKKRRTDSRNSPSPKQKSKSPGPSNVQQELLRALGETVQKYIPKTSVDREEIDTALRRISRINKYLNSAKEDLDKVHEFVKNLK